MEQEAEYLKNFNPRSRTGSDAWQKEYQVLAMISTHAPAQGATYGSDQWRRKSRFQPTLPHRERRQPSKQPQAVSLFQPTLPHRERPQISSNRSTDRLFQPTLPHRERLRPSGETLRKI